MVRKTELESRFYLF